MRTSSVAVVVAAALASGLGLGGVLAQDRPQDQPLGAPGGRASPPPSGSGAPREVRDPAVRDLSDYRLRVDDEIEVAVHKPGSFEPQMVRRLTVPASGDVSFSPVGKIRLLNRTGFEIEEEVTRRLREQGFLNDPNVGVYIAKYAPRTVSVIGAVRSAVELPTNRDLRVLELMSHIRGLDTENGDFSRCEIRRCGPDGRPFRFEVDLDEVFRRDEDSKNVVVREGDIVKVPRLERGDAGASEHCFVLGKVNTRGKIPISRTRGPFTLVKLIAVCGDFTEFADRSGVKVIRHTETGRRTETIDFDDIIEGKRPDFEIRPDDVVWVPESFL